jgi:tetrathionate reductase subunit B
MNRREFLSNTLVVFTGAAAPAFAREWLDPRDLLNARPELRWAFLIDTYACAGCGLCVKACKLENDIPYDAEVTRTWVERYVRTRSGTALADLPGGGRDGFISGEVRLPGKRTRTIPESEIEGAFFVPKLCNHCNNPSCVQVCPVGATYATAEGVVLIDRQWCIGCGYCIMGCPYGGRFFHPVHRVADKCTFCYHRLGHGMTAACVLACSFGGRRMGNLRDLDDPVTRTILEARVAVLKDQYGTRPQAYYLGLSKEVH